MVALLPRHRSSKTPSNTSNICSNGSKASTCESDDSGYLWRTERSILDTLNNWALNLQLQKIGPHSPYMKATARCRWLTLSNYLYWSKCTTPVPDILTNLPKEYNIRWRLSWIDLPWIAVFASTTRPKIFVNTLAKIFIAVFSRVMAQ